MKFKYLKYSIIVLSIFTLSFFIINGMENREITKLDNSIKTFKNETNQKVSDIKKNFVKKPSINMDFGKIPLYFIQNTGQVNKKAAFYSKASRYTLWITKGGLVFDSLIKDKGKDNNKENFKEKLLEKYNRDVSRMVFIGTNKDPEIIAIDPSKLKVNYFKGQNKTKWNCNVPTSKAVLYKNIYKNIDLKVYGKEKSIEYDWIVKPGGDPKDIKFEYQNVKKTQIDQNGDLQIYTKFGQLIHKKPVSFQIIKVDIGFSNSKKREMVNVNFKVFADKSYGFEIESYDKSKTLIIDPVVLLYSTYLGGNFVDWLWDLTVDNSGNIYAIGETYSTDFPIVNQYQSSNISGDVFITKINTNLNNESSLIYSTYFGGDNNDYGYGISVDNNENVYIVGTTLSSDLPVINQYQSNQNSYDAFIARFDTRLSGESSLVYATYLGGENVDYGLDIAVDGNNNVYITGYTYLSPDFPVINQYQTIQGDRDTFVARIDTNNIGVSSLIYSTFLGGIYVDQGNGIDVDNNNNVYVVGTTNSPDFPLLNQYQTYQGYSDAFITKIDTNLSGESSLIYSSYIGGNGSESGNAIVVDKNNNAYITGETWKTRTNDIPNFPVLNQYQHSQGGHDAFVTRIDTTQIGDSSLIYSSYLGGSSSDVGEGIDVDNNGNVYVSGSTYSSNFPVLYEYQKHQLSMDIFISKLNTNIGGESSLIFSTYLGGSNYDSNTGIAIDSKNHVYVAGWTDSQNYPIKNSYQNIHRGQVDSCITKLSFNSNADLSIQKIVDNPSPYIGEDIAYTIKVTNIGPADASDVKILDKLPNGLIFVSYTSVNGNYSSQKDVWDIKQLRNGKSAELKIISKVERGGIFTNEASLISLNEIDPKKRNNMDSVTISTSHIILASISGGKGTISPLSQNVLFGETANLKITPEYGYEIESIIDNGVFQTISKLYSIKNVINDHNLIVKFKPKIILTLSGERKTEKVWIIKKDYGKLFLAVNDPSKMASVFILQRSENGGEYINLMNLSPSDLIDGKHVYIDKFFEKNSTYKYQFLAYDSEGNVLSKSNEIAL